MTLERRDLCEAFFGNFVAWWEIIRATGAGLRDNSYDDSPIELVNRLIDERDDLHNQLSRLVTSMRAWDAARSGSLSASIDEFATLLHAAEGVVEATGGKPAEKVDGV